jgi:nitrogen fixation NifU-like protein
MADQNTLYNPIILEHNKSPFHFEKKEDFKHQIEAYNPVCGDQFKIFIETSKDQIKQLYFHGYGCAVSKAAASILIKNAQNLGLDELKQMLHQYLDNIKHGNLEENSKYKAEFDAFKIAKEFPGRLSCATLSWDKMLEYLPILEGKKSL